MTEPIRGKVARILNAQELAINVGIAHGVHVGMYFDVLDVNGQVIKDPDTNEVLGSIECPKIRIKITQAQEKFSVAVTHRKKHANTSTIPNQRTNVLGPYARFLMPPSWVQKYEAPWTNDKPDEVNSKVQTGDPVLQVLEVDEPEQENTNKK